jgi:uncharacterized protein (AIM24 family)
MTMHDQLLGSTQPVLSISLEPGETIVAGAGEFAWMTDSIQMSTAGAGLAPTAATGALRRSLDASSLQLSAYTASAAAGTIAFASRLPGSILGIDVAPDREYLVHRHGFLAGTPGIEIRTGYQQHYDSAHGTDEFVLRRISGRGRAWVELSGEVVRRDLTAGASLRTHPWHIGMSDSSVAVQMTVLDGVGADLFGNEASRFAVVSGPGAVWLQSMPLLATAQARLTQFPPQVQGLPASPAAEGEAGSGRQALADRSDSSRK